MYRFFEQTHSCKVYIGATPHMSLIIEAKYAILVDVLAARNPTNVHPCPPCLLSTLRLIDLGGMCGSDMVMKRLSYPKIRSATTQKAGRIQAGYQPWHIHCINWHTGKVLKIIAPDTMRSVLVVSAHAHARSTADMRYGSMIRSSHSDQS